MGQAKRKREADLMAAPVVYHHTSTLRTNLMWMSGVIELEGRGMPAIHPHLGEIRTDTLRRRAMKDFPAVAWFTSEIDIPNCLRKVQILLVDQDTGKVRRDHSTGRDLGDALALNRVAIGFRLSENPGITPWPNHYGYATSEGKELNESAREVGDDPDKWFVSEQPVDLLKAIQFWGSNSVINPRLERHDSYVKDMHNMVRACRDRKGVYIPPTFLKPDEARLLAAMMSVPAFRGDTDLAAIGGPA